MLTVLHLNASNFYGGPEKQIVEHLKRLNKQKYTGIVASFAENKEEKAILKKADEAGQKNFAIPVNGPLDRDAFHLLRKELVERRVNLLCTHGFKASVTGWWVARQLELPLIVFSRGYTAENMKVALYEWLERRVLRKADAIISVSEGQRIKLEMYGIIHPRHFVVHNAVDTGGIKPAEPAFRERFLAEHNIPPSAVVAAAVGRLSPEKGHEILLRALAQLTEAVPDLYLLICGDGVCHLDLRELAEKMKISGRVRFLGFRSDIDSIYQVMDFLVLPSFTEGLPNVVLEAFAHKKAVVATDVGGVPELVRNGENGLIVPSGNSEALAGAIKTMCQSAQTRFEMGLKGLQTVTENFSFENQNRKLESVYDRVLGVEG